MKHLTTYKLFEASLERLFTDEQLDDIKNNIEDILIAFKDSYIPVNIKTTEYVKRKSITDRLRHGSEHASNVTKSGNYYQISITIGHELADLDDYQINVQNCGEDLIRLDDYLQSEGFTLSNYMFDDSVRRRSPKSSNINEIIEELTGKEIVSLDLFYVKYKDLNESFEQSDWNEVNGKLQKQFEFKDFSEALDFINKLAELCESENHHPEINWVYNKIQLSLSTHDAGDVITEKDINLSKLIDEMVKDI